MAYRNTFFRWLFLYSLTFGLTYVLKLFTYLCPETGHFSSWGRCAEVLCYAEQDARLGVLEKTDLCA